MTETAVRVALAHGPGRMGIAASNVLLGGHRIGVLQYSVADGERGATIQRIELDTEYRGWGYGTEAVRLLEDRLAEAGVDTVSARVDPGDGLGLYFWLRLGYRPAGVSRGESATIRVERSLFRA